ncbi:MAG: XRE family transcriptional regulator [Cyanobacteria bacterium DS2.3.42]|jgi:transcriptional regulator with XRE-family HTH domain|nr:XRE family transcriptional regulator [Cyanobacteria bacterium DS2.3.42]
MANKRPNHNHLYRCLGEVINARRKRLKLTQDELAAESGVNRAFISNIEQGRRNPSIGAVASIAKGLRTRVSKMLAKCEECMIDQEKSA